MVDYKKLACVIGDSSVANNINKYVKNLGSDVEVLSFSSFERLQKSVNFEIIDYLIYEIEQMEADYEIVMKIMKTKFPHIIRIIISDKMSENLLISTHELVHMIFEKKNINMCLKDMFARANKLRVFLQNKDLIKIVNSYDTKSYLKSSDVAILQQIQRPDVSLKLISDLIENDLFLSTKVLQMANMAIFGNIKRVNNIQTAVISLGLNIIRALILNIRLFGEESSRNHLLKYFKELETHSNQVANDVVHVIEALGLDSSLQKDAFTAGFIHDIGRMIIIEKIKDWEKIAHQSKIEKASKCDAEKKLIGTTHAEIGAFFLCVWGFPMEIVEAVAYHHKPSDYNGTGNLVLMITHITEALNQKHSSEGIEFFLDSLDPEYLDRLGYLEQVKTCYYEYFGIELDEEQNNEDE